MRAAVLTDRRELAIEERSRPMPSAEEVLVRMRSIGICGSDVHYYEHGRIGQYEVEGPLVLGHESAGEVVEAGRDVTSLEPGDRVALEPGLPCGRCRQCREGRYHLCSNLEFMATPPDDGAFAEYVAWPGDFAHRLPSDVSYREGALCEPLSVGLHATDQGDVDAGDAVSITGAGPIGLAIMEAAMARGATDVIVSDVVDRKLELAADRGADVVVDAGERDLADVASSHTDGEGVDVAIEASGATAAYDPAIRSIRDGGTLVCVGLAQADEVPLDLVQLTLREIRLQGVIRFNNTYPTAIDLLAAGDVDVEGLIDGTYPLEAIEDSFDAAMDPETVKVVVEPRIDQK